MSHSYLSTHDKSKHDPYWDFDKDKHFRPKVNKGDFFKLTGYEFGRLILKPLWEFVKKTEYLIERGKCLSYGQKALYYWWKIDAEVTNGGFVQFYYNGYGPYVHTIIKALEHIGDLEMAALIQHADNIYQNSKDLIDVDWDEDLFGSDIYEKLQELSALEDKYYKLNKKTISNIENYIRKHPDEFCLDEDGKAFDMKVSGECKTFHPDQKVKEIFILEKGVIDGAFKSFYENGNLKEQIQFLKGEPTGERMEYYENGNKKSSVRKDINKNWFEYLWYHENGNPKKLEHKQSDNNERVGEYKEWYSNGQLAEAGTYISTYEREGSWLEYYKDGSKKLDAEYRNEECLIHNYWNEHGEQILKDGTGLYIHKIGGSEYYEQEYKNYKKHGIQKTYYRGVLSLYQEMEDGVEHGYTRGYYRNGKIKEEILYKNGIVVSVKRFPRSENLVGKVTFKYMMKEEWLKKEGLPIADTYPECINEAEIKKIIKTPPLLFVPHYQDTTADTCLWLSVDEKGNVTNVKFQSSYMTRGEEFTEVADKMKFIPATKGGINVASYIYIIAEFTLE
jgi:antitoxin component YwqK of YwqJK toxin-antitoxin module